MSVETGLNVKIVVEDGANPPSYETAGSAGMDISAHLEKPITLRAGFRAVVPTGIYIELPRGYEAQIRARSGLAVRNGIGMANGIGTIDSDYRGEILVALINHGADDFVINDGDRIAQMVVAKYERVDWEVTDSLEDSDRGEGGFGSTGV
jgi:dUTP pyrophosphatase